MKSYIDIYMQIPYNIAYLSWVYHTEQVGTTATVQVYSVGGGVELSVTMVVTQAGDTPIAQ